MAVLSPHSYRCNSAFAAILIDIMAAFPVVLIEVVFSSTSPMAELAILGLNTLPGSEMAVRIIFDMLDSVGLGQMVEDSTSAAQLV